MVTGWMFVNFHRYGTSYEVVSVVRERVEAGRDSEGSTRVYTADDEDIRWSGLVQVNDGLYAEVPLWCASGPIARRWIVPTCV
jgi:hypothetical protein